MSPRSFFSYCSNKLSVIKTVVLNRLTPAIKKIRAVLTDFFIGDLSASLEPSIVRNKLENSENGIAIFRVGPPLIGWQIVFLQPNNLSLNQIRNVLRFIMELDEPAARSPYDINWVTGSSFFLGMSNKEARPLRERTIPHFSPNNFKTLLPAIIKKEFNKDILSLFLKMIYGSDENSKEAKYLLNEIMLFNSIKLFYFFFPDWIQKLTPTFRAKQSTIDGEIKSFLRKQFQILKKSEEKEKAEIKHLSHDIIHSKLSNSKKLHELNDADIERLIVDPEVRLCVVGLLAIHNLQSVIDSGLFHLFSSSIFNKKISHEMESFSLEEKESIQDHLNDKIKMPFLHAFWLETLRVHAPMPDIVRYTKRGFKVENISVPPKSLVLFKLGEVLKLSYGTKQYPASIFEPARFLTDQNTLREEASSHQGLLDAQGEGRRRCPAYRISALIFKAYMIAEVREKEKREIKSQSSQVGLFAKPNETLQAFLAAMVREIELKLAR